MFKEAAAFNGDIGDGELTQKVTSMLGTCSVTKRIQPIESAAVSLTRTPRLNHARFMDITTLPQYRP